MPKAIGNLAKLEKVAEAEGEGFELAEGKEGELLGDAGGWGEEVETVIIEAPEGKVGGDDGLKV